MCGGSCRLNRISLWLNWGNGWSKACRCSSASRDSGTSSSGLDYGVKKTLHASEQDTEVGRQRRQAWWEQIVEIDPRRLVFLDESGVTTEMTRRYGRAARGQRVAEGTPAGHWRTLTVLGAIRASGWAATMT